MLSYRNIVKLLCLHLHLGDYADAFIQRNLQPFIHTFTHRRRSRPLMATEGGFLPLSGAVRVRCLAQGHLDTRDQTWNHLVTNQLALPPEPHAASSRFQIYFEHDITVKRPQVLLFIGHLSGTMHSAVSEHKGTLMTVVSYWPRLQQFSKSLGSG